MLRPQVLLTLVVLLGCYQEVQSAVSWMSNDLDIPNFGNLESYPVESNSEEVERRTKRGAADFRRSKWNRDALPYTLDTRYNETEKTILRAGIQTFIDNTCITFKEDVGDGTGTWLVYHMAAETVSCQSEVGDTRGGRWNVTVDLTNGCINIPAIQHETFHALGFRHTHTRPDRDNYIFVDFDNISKERTKLNYEKLNVTNGTTDYGIPYEYNSILHYASHINQQFDANKPTIRPLDMQYFSTVGRAGRMIYNDWKLINLHYKCNEICNLPISCINGGYQHPRECDRCVCAQFFKGKRCEEELGVINLVQGQPVQLADGWKRDGILRNLEIRDVNKFNRSDVHIIKAPEGTRIRVTINHITDPYQNFAIPKEGSKSCFLFALEIVDADLTRVGKRFCTGDNIGETVLSTTNIIGYAVYQSPGYGFSANVTLTVEGTPVVVPQTELPPTVTSTTTLPHPEEQTTTVAVTEVPVTQPPTTTVPAPGTTTAEKIPTAAPEPPTEAPVTESAPTTQSQDTTTAEAQPTTTNPPTESPATEATQPSTIKPYEPVATTTEDPEGDYWCKNEAV